MQFRHVLDLLRKMILRKVGSSGSGIGDGIIPLKSLGFVPFFVPSSKQRNVKRKDGVIISSGSGNFLSALIWSGAGASTDTVDTTAHGRMHGAGLVGGTSWNIAKNRQLYAFSSTIKRIRINHGTALPLATDEDSVGHIPEQQHRQEVEEASFVQYEITCQLTVQCTNSTTLGEGGDRQMSWSIWKRYSEFQSLDAKLRKTFGWHLNGGQSVLFPPSHHLRWMWIGACSGGCKNNRLWQKQNQNHRRGGLNRADDSKTTMHQKFVHQRREELKIYWEALCKCEMIFDFADPSLRRYSRDMASSLELERYFPRSGGVRRGTCGGGGGGSSSSAMGDGLSFSSSHGIQRRNFNTNSSADMDASTMSQQSSQLSSRCEQSIESSLPLDRNHGGEIILTEKSIETTSMLPNPSPRGDGGQKQKRIAAVAKPAFQRRLLDLL